MDRGQLGCVGTQDAVAGQNRSAGGDTSGKCTGGPVMNVQWQMRSESLDLAAPVSYHRGGTHNQMRTVAGADRDHRNRLQCLTQTHLVGQDPTARTRQSRQPGNSLHLIRAQSRLNLCSAKTLDGRARFREQPHRGRGASDLRVVALDSGMRCGRNVMCAGVDDALPREQRRSEVAATSIEVVERVDRGGEVEQLRFDVGCCDRLVDRDRKPAHARRPGRHPQCRQPRCRVCVTPEREGHVLGNVRSLQARRAWLIHVRRC